MKIGKEKWQMKESEESNFLAGHSKIEWSRSAQQNPMSLQTLRPQASCMTDIKNEAENEGTKWCLFHELFYFPTSIYS